MRCNSLMRKAFDEYKKRLRTSDIIDEWDTWNVPSIYEMIINVNFKKEKEEMGKTVLTNLKENNLVTVNYEGRTYYVDEFESNYDLCRAYPICRVVFTPYPGRLVHDAPKDSRCTKCPPNDFNIDKVTFNGPKTIVEWKDGTKTIVNCNDEVRDPEKGLAMAIVKKVFGNKGNYYNTFRKAMENARYYNQPEEPNSRIAMLMIAKLIGGQMEEKTNE